MKTKIEFNKSPIIVISHRRSGTHWTMDAIRNNLVGVENYHFNLDRISNNHPKYIPANELIEKINNSKNIPILKSHMTSNLTPFLEDEKIVVEELLQNSKVIYVYRDGRDVLASLFHYMKTYDSSIPSFNQFIRMNNNFDEEYNNLNRVEYWKKHVYGWNKLKKSNLYLMSYEDLYFNYENTVHKLADYLKLPIISSEISKVELQRPSLLRKVFNLLNIGRSQSSAIVPRKGITGDWEDIFSNDDLIFFNDIAEDIMTELKYYGETDNK